MAGWAAEYLASRINYGDLVASREDPRRTGVVQGLFTIPEHWPQPRQLFCWGDGNRCEAGGASQPCLENSEPYEPGQRYLILCWDEHTPHRLDRVRAETVTLSRKNPSPRRHGLRGSRVPTSDRGLVGLRGGQIDVPDGPPPRRPPVTSPAPELYDPAAGYHGFVAIMLPLAYTYCRDCGEDTLSDEPEAATEWYMVHDGLWRAAGMRGGHLCVGCLESRLGRQLSRADFTDSRLHDLSIWNSRASWSWRSKRLTGRLMA